MLPLRVLKKTERMRVKVKTNARPAMDFRHNFLFSSFICFSWVRGGFYGSEIVHFIILYILIDRDK